MFRKHSAYHFEQSNSWKCSSYARKYIIWSNENFQITPTPSRIQYHDRFNQTETTLRASFIILNISKVNCLQNSSIPVSWDILYHRLFEKPIKNIEIRHRKQKSTFAIGVAVPIDLNTNILENTTPFLRIAATLVYRSFELVNSKFK